MQKKTVDTFIGYIEFVDKLKTNTANLILFRGQSEENPLIPSISRDNPKKDTTDLEKKMLAELKRRARTKIIGMQFDEWDWLIYARHHEMKTRLLDWTSNPLVALWFACCNEDKMKKDPVVYILRNADKHQFDKSKEPSPFKPSKTKVLKPSLNNKRIIAQSGYFTVHNYSYTAKHFVDLRKNPKIKDSLVEVKIPYGIKRNVLVSLDVFGINSQTILSDITGICKHINWVYIKQMINE